MAFVRSDDVRPLRVLDDELRLLQRSADSANRMSVMRVDVPPEGGVPPHSHAREEEAYFVLEGVLEMIVGDERRRLEAGDFAHVPPGTRHGYRNPGPQSVRFLAWTVGGPIDEFFVGVSESVRRMPDDAGALDRLMRTYGILPAG
jgi:quercetin dioxygenase-like cupin family protein